MRYKRQETFRYVFGTPIECEFTIINVNGKQVDSKPGKAKIYDLSPGGLKVSTQFNLLSQKNKLEVEIRFSLMEENVVRGEIIWQDFSSENHYYYGVYLFIDEEKKSKLIKELKNYIQKEKEAIK